MWLVGLAVVAVLGGCDVAFGLSGDPGPCAPSSFAAVMPKDVTPAEDFSISRDRALAVVALAGMTYEVTLPDRLATPMTLGDYNPLGLALAPEGTSLFFTEAIEPPTLRGALRAGAGSWELGARAPAGTFAGTPSADEFGPRRVLVKLRDARDDVQEYEDDDGVWRPHGDVHTVASELAPNLTPNGLTMVYLAIAPDTQQRTVSLATRESGDVWFGEPVAILEGAHHAPQLLDTCRALYVVDDTGDPTASQMLREYDQP